MIKKDVVSDKKSARRLQNLETLGYFLVVEIPRKLKSNTALPPTLPTFKGKFPHIRLTNFLTANMGK